MIKKPFARNHYESSRSRERVVRAMPKEERDLRATGKFKPGRDDLSTLCCVVLKSFHACTDIGETIVLPFPGIFLPGKDAFLLLAGIVDLSNLAVKQFLP